jgi:hypothetical protein
MALPKNPDAVTTACDSTRLPILPVVGARELLGKAATKLYTCPVIMFRTKWKNLGDFVGDPIDAVLYGTG